MYLLKAQKTILHLLFDYVYLYPFCVLSNLPWSNNESQITILLAFLECLNKAIFENKSKKLFRSK